jgi:hypothetical protein
MLSVDITVLRETRTFGGRIDVIIVGLGCNASRSASRSYYRISGAAEGEEEES